MLLRDARAGELRLLAAAMLIAVASLTAVGFFADRVRLALEREAHQLLGADLLLIADQPWPASIGEMARQQGREIKGRITLLALKRFINGDLKYGYEEITPPPLPPVAS